MAAHAKLSASASARWLNCPASVKMTADLPNGSSLFAAEGTAAHSLAELCLTTNTWPDAHIGSVIEGFDVDSEMAENVTEYVAYVRGLPGDHFYEHRVDFSQWIPGGFGTADAIVIDRQHVTIVDLKYGKGVRVDAENNTQAQLYALGVMSDFNWLAQFETFTVVIVQPRLGHISEWSFSALELLKFASYAQERATLATSDYAPFGPSEKACQWCGAKGFCRALADYNLSLMQSQFDDLTIKREPSSLTAEHIALLLPHVGLISNWIKAVEVHASEMLNRGETVPGFKLVEGRSIRKWSGDTVETQIVELLGDDAYVKKLISPAQAEKLLGKEKGKLSDFIVKPAGRPVIAPIGDKRKALSGVNVCFDVLESY